MLHSQAGTNHNFYFQRVLGATAGNTIELGNVNFDPSFGAASPFNNFQSRQFSVRVLDSTGGQGSSKVYYYFLNANGNGNVWQEALPLFSSGVNDGEYAVDVKQDANGAPAYLRLRRKTTAALGTTAFDVILETFTLDQTFNPTSATGTGASQPAFFGMAISPEPHDADLTTIAGLTAANDDVIQRKSGAWTNRTMAQLRSDLGIGRGVFKVNRNGTQQTGLTAGAFNKVNLTTEVVDIEGWFDNATNYRYTPLIAGWYFFNASCTWDSASGGESPILSVHKNGASGIKGNYLNLSTGVISFYVAQVSGMLYLNGSTDYAELFIYLPAGTTIDGQVERTYLSGYLIRPD